MQSNRLVKELQFSLTQIVSTNEEKYTQIHLHKTVTLDVIENKNRFCYIETKGCSSPLVFHMYYNENAGYPPGMDLQIYFSLIHKEPSFSNC
jgi:hypothetical protein